MALAADNIGHWQGGLYGDLLLAVRRTYVVRHSAVGLSELRRGARTRTARKLVDDLRRLARRLWAPIESDGWEAGRLVRDIGDAQDWETAKRREFQNDALIALTARRRGATVVTTNADDFGLLRETLKVRVVFAARPLGHRRVVGVPERRAERQASARLASGGRDIAALKALAPDAGRRRRE